MLGKFLPTILLIVVIGGCGFQLRSADISGLGAISLSGQAAGGLRRELEAFLEANDVKSVAPGPNIVDVRLLDVRSSRRPVATSVRMDAAQYELRLEVDVVLILDGKPVVADFSLAAQRIYSLDSLNLSGSYEEEQLLMSEIREEIVNLIVFRLEAWQQATNR